ncbi:hypothetical protein [Phenylobacterium montanum]|uniref:Uncharacterized protein n=1 Tax=Phenylobacterium montanum TaxID=2823693 RepID=A0A975FZS6_9CAUL|nr:hypothetical protein [Caulobacter sp. S6]QUD87922.1 hypothetical protein KCG34_23250 [Caulobacter sp. S6]
MSTRSLQIGLGAVFFGLGGWCVVAPASMLALCVRPQFQSQAVIVPILAGCFGAQAMIAGLFAVFSRFSRTTFLAYGIGLLPFFAFDAYFYLARPILTEIGFASDLGGNLIMLAICWAGWRTASEA